MTPLDSTLPLTNDKETTQGAAGTGEGRGGPLHKNLPRLAEYKNKMDNRLATELENRKAELEAVAKAAKVQESILEKSTTDQYLRYRRYWTVRLPYHVSVTICLASYLSINREYRSPARPSAMSTNTGRTTSLNMLLPVFLWGS